MSVTIPYKDFSFLLSRITKILSSLRWRAEPLYVKSNLFTNFV